MHCLYRIPGQRILKNSFSGIYNVYHTAATPNPSSQGLAGLHPGVTTVGRILKAEHQSPATVALAFALMCAVIGAGSTCAVKMPTDIGIV